MTTDEQRKQWIDKAYSVGVDRANMAASWTYDGNSDVEERARVLAMLRAGDPVAHDYLPRRPDLSGEFADALTPLSLVEEFDSLTCAFGPDGLIDLETMPDYGGEWDNEADENVIESVTLTYDFFDLVQ